MVNGRVKSGGETAQATTVNLYEHCRHMDSNFNLKKPSRLSIQSSSFGAGFSIFYLLFTIYYSRELPNWQNHYRNHEAP